MGSLNGKQEKTERERWDELEEQMLRNIALSLESLQETKRLKDYNDRQIKKCEITKAVCLIAMALIMMFWLVITALEFGSPI